MKKIIVFTGMMLLAACVCASGKKDSAPKTQAADTEPTGEIIISAAASLTNAMNDCISLYESHNSALQVTPTYGSSGSLRAQIEQGAPADIFFSASASHMQKLAGEGLVLDGTKTDLLKNEVVLIVPAGNPGKLSSFQDAAGDNVQQIAIGEPESVPAGNYAKQVFTALKIWDTITGANKFVFGKDVRQVLSYVEQGEVQAGVVYSTDAAISRGVTIVCSAPEGTHKPIIYPVAIVKATTNEAAARSFTDFLKSTDALNIFKKYGFLSAAE